MADDLIIEVRVNEWAKREFNGKHVPYTSQEIADAAGACAAAGASIIHYHARDKNGGRSTELENYSETARLIRKQNNGLMIMPTLGMSMLATAQERIAHIQAMAADAATKPELAPVDMACCNLDVFDDVDKYVRRPAEPYINKTSDWIIYAGIMNALRIKPVPIIWSVGSVRWTKAMVDMKLFNGPLWCELVLTAGTRAVLLDAHPGTDDGLRAYLDFLPKEAGWHWAVMVHAADMSHIAQAAIDKGGHIAIGLGDFGYPNLDGIAEPTNAQLVQHIVRLAEKAKRAIATPEKARRMLGV